MNLLGSVTVSQSSWHTGPEESRQMDVKGSLLRECPLQPSLESESSFWKLES